MILALPSMTAHSQCAWWHTTHDSGAAAIRSRHIMAHMQWLQSIHAPPIGRGMPMHAAYTIAQSRWRTDADTMPWGGHVHCCLHHTQRADICVQRRWRGAHSRRDAALGGKKEIRGRQSHWSPDATGGRRTVVSRSMNHPTLLKGENPPHGHRSARCRGRGLENQEGFQLPRDNRGEWEARQKTKQNKMKQNLKTNKQKQTQIKQNKTKQDKTKLFPSLPINFLLG